MSRNFPDEFVVVPKNNHHTVRLDVEHSGSRDPLCLNESGRQHRPAGPVHDALRFVGEVEVGSNSGFSHARELSMGSVPIVTGSSPETLVDEPGKTVNSGTRVSSEHSSPAAAMLRDASALRKGSWGYRQAHGYGLAPIDSRVNTPITPRLPHFYQFFSCFYQVSPGQKRCF